MKTETTVLDRALRDAFEQAYELGERRGMIGYGVAELRDSKGRLKSATPFSNLITDAGDLYYATKCIVGIAPASPSAPTAVSGMKLGTGTTAVAKNGAGAALVTYLTASNVAFNTGYPQAVNLGAGAGVNSSYQTVWAAGVATNAAITEVVIVNDQATNATSTAANTISRALPTSINKQAGDTLTITWNHRNLGA